jgi:hypothetical protein
MKARGFEIAKQFMDLYYLSSVGKEIGNNLYRCVLSPSTKLVNFINKAMDFGTLLAILSCFVKIQFNIILHSTP